MHGATKRLCALLLLGVALSAPGLSSAHDILGDGTPVPTWVKWYCCGVSDVHRLTAGQIRRVEGGYYAEGYQRFIPERLAMPSQDDFVWLFYVDLPDGSQSGVICFFIPQGAV
jgi:hypothetical protein